MPTPLQCSKHRFITFGAQLGAPSHTDIGQNDYFVVHWWNMVEPTLPPNPGDTPLPSSTAATLPVSSSQSGVTTAEKVKSGDDHGSEWDLKRVKAGKVIDLNESQHRLPTSEDFANPPGDVPSGAGGPGSTSNRTSTLGVQQVTEQCEMNDKHCDLHDAVAEGDNTTTEVFVSNANALPQETVRALEEGFLRHSASLLRDWEDWVMAAELHPERHRGTTVVIRAGVRHGGVRGHAQSLMLNLEEGDQIDITLQVRTTSDV